jgi:predicted Abi (CAAX) family protease
VVAIAHMVTYFGVKKIKIAQYAEVMLNNAQNTNPQCKTAAYDYYKGIYKWVGDAILPQIEDKLKKAQMVSGGADLILGRLDQVI